MSSEITKTQKQGECRLCIGEKFDHSVHKELRESYVGVRTPDMTFIVDLSQTTCIDGAALGMLLLLREHAKKYNSVVVIDRPNSAVSKLLKVSSFDHFMQINW